MLKKKRLYKVENINPEKGITASVRLDERENKYVVCLCLAHKTIKNLHCTEQAAMHDLWRYKQLYKPIKNNH